MKRTTSLILVVLGVAIIWPVLFQFYLVDYLRSNTPSRGQMQDFELQKLLNASRWVIDIPFQVSHPVNRSNSKCVLNSPPPWVE